ncbi:MAG TPA: hypothetical protein VF748_16415 [Candidatus Acidoferrum sp.]
MGNLVDPHGRTVAGKLAPVTSGVSVSLAAVGQRAVPLMRMVTAVPVAGAWLIAPQRAQGLFLVDGRQVYVPRMVYAARF